MELILALIGIIVVVFILTHLRPLTEDEVRQLGKKRRRKKFVNIFLSTKENLLLIKNLKKG